MLDNHNKTGLRSIVSNIAMGNAGEIVSSGIGGLLPFDFVC